MLARRFLAFALLMTTFQAINAWNHRRIKMKQLSLNNVCAQTSPDDLEHCRKLKKRNASDNETHSLPLKGYFRSLHYGEVLLGTPPQKLMFTFDTSFSTILITSRLCEIFDEKSSHVPYDGRKSETYNGSSICVRMQDLNGRVNNHHSVDDLKIGDITIKQQIFYEAVTKLSKVHSLIGVDGIIGLGFNKFSRVRSILDNMLTQEQIHEKVFSFSFNSDGNGQLTFGGTDKSLYKINTLNYFPLSSSNVWQIEMRKISIDHSIKVPGEALWCFDGCLALINPGSALIHGPKKSVDTLHAYLGLTDGPKPNRVPCHLIKSLPPIAFFFGDHKYTLEPVDYIVNASSSGEERCISAFIYNENSQRDWVLGKAFLAKWYSVFDADNSRIGFAELNHK